MSIKRGYRDNQNLHRVILLEFICLIKSLHIDIFYICRFVFKIQSSTYLWVDFRKCLTKLNPILKWCIILSTKLKPLSTNIVFAFLSLKWFSLLYIRLFLAPYWFYFNNFTKILGQNVERSNKNHKSFHIHHCCVCCPLSLSDTVAVRPFGANFERKYLTSPSSSQM